MGDGDPHDSVGYVNEYCRSSIGGTLVCELDPVKGRILRVAAGHSGFEAGDRLLAEPPLLLVAEAPASGAFEEVRRLAKRRNFAHDPIWYWSALCSLREEDLRGRGCALAVPAASREQHEQLLLLCHPEGDRDASDVAALVAEFWPPEAQDVAEVLQVLLLVWLHNCFEHTEEPVGFSTFFLPSFLSHDCRPNAMWHYEGSSFALRARQCISPGEEVTVSYLAEEALLESTDSRRAQLQASKSFCCRCGACAAALDIARGFVCPACSEGELFPEITEPGASSSFRCCKACGFLPTAEQAGELLAQEALVEQRVRLWERRAPRAGPEAYLSDEAAASVEASLAQLLSPRHWLRDKVRRQLMAYYEATGRLDLALPLAAQSAQHVLDAWPGVTAIRAWALEAQGDLELRRAHFPCVTSSEVAAPQDARHAELDPLLQGVAPLYREAAEALRLLFGEGHDFARAMRAKCEAAEQILAEHFVA